MFGIIITQPYLPLQTYMFYQYQLLFILNIY